MIYSWIWRGKGLILTKQSRKVLLKEVWYCRSEDVEVHACLALLMSFPKSRHNRQHRNLVCTFIRMSSPRFIKLYSPAEFLKKYFILSKAWWKVVRFSSTYLLKPTYTFIVYGEKATTNNSKLISLFVSLVCWFYSRLTCHATWTLKYSLSLHSWLFNHIDYIYFGWLTYYTDIQTNKAFIKDDMTR